MLNANASSNVFFKYNGQIWSENFDFKLAVIFEKLTYMCEEKWIFMWQRLNVTSPLKGEKWRFVIANNKNKNTLHTKLWQKGGLEMAKKHVT